MKKTFNLISVSREAITWHSVTSGTIVDKKRMSWNIENPESVEKIKQELITLIKDKKVRILFEEDSYYLIKIPYERMLSRQEIYKLISSRVPEDFNVALWDYFIEEEEIIQTKKKGEKKEKKHKDEDKKEIHKQFLVFVPVKKIADELVKLFTEQEIVVEAIEPIQIASKRNENPVIGLALKKDLEGRDEEVLNISTKEIQKGQEKIKAQDISKFKEKESLYKRLTGSNIFMILLFITLVGGSILMLFNYQKKAKDKATQDAKISQISETEKSSQPKIIKEMAEIKILIMVEKLPSERAEEIKESLDSLGVESIVLEEAEESIEESVLVAREDIERGLLEEILSQLETANITVSEEKLGNNVENHIVLFIKD